MRIDLRIDLANALAWRLQRHCLAERSGQSVEDVARAVVALRGWPAGLAELAVAVRRSGSESGELTTALAAGDVIRSYAFRGGSYVFTPAIGAVLLSVHTAGRSWEKERFQRQAGFTLADWDPLRAAMREILAAGPQTRRQIADALAATPRLRKLAPAAAGAGADTLYKPLHWWGDICFGPDRDGDATFRALGGDPSWPGLPDADDAGRMAIEFYLGAYGPVTDANLHYWLAEGLGAPRRRVLQWLADLGDRVTTVVVGGDPAYVRTVDLDELVAAEPTDQLRLLPGFDPWLMGPGTADTRLLAAQRRSVGTRGANVVIQGGVVSGVWRSRNDEVTVSWFEEAGPMPKADLAAEVQHLADLQGTSLTLIAKTSTDET